MNLSAISTALPPLHLRSCLIHRQGQLVLEHYRDVHTVNEIVKINSCTKSILSALICIAMDMKLLPEPDTRISEFFPSLKEDRDERKRDITLRHLLTMSGGWNWTEFGGHNSFPRMTRSPDWVRFALEQPMADQPGDRMEYNSGCSQLLSAILVQASGLSTAEFAERYLFGPLGIEAYHWEQDPQGIHTGGFGLSLRPADLLKFGLLYLHQGVWNGRRLISSELSTLSVQPAIDVEAPRRGCYAWHWWTDIYAPDLEAAGVEAPAGFEYFFAQGYGGQFIYVIPRLGTVVVLTDDKRKKDRPPVHVFRDCIAPYL